MSRPPEDPPNVRRLSDKLPIGLVPGIELEDPPVAGEPVDYPHMMRALADSLTDDLAAERAAHTQQVEQLVEQRDWAFVNRDTHYQRVLQLEDENAELRRQVAELRAAH